MLGAGRPQAFRTDAAEPEVPLAGGDVTEGVVRVGSTVRRPQGPASPWVHRLLDHLEGAGFDGAPRFLGVDDQGREVLSFVPGEVAGRPRPGWIADEGRLVSVARLLRRFDDCSATLGLPAGCAELGPPELPGMPPAPVGAATLLGHLDITPENVVFDAAGQAVALIDFDLVRPATRVDEVVNALRWWAELSDPVDRDPRMRGVDVFHRSALFVDSYGLGRDDRSQVVPAALVRQERAWHLMRWRAETDGGGWARMWRDGVGDQIRRTHAWIERNAAALDAALGVGLA